MGADPASGRGECQELELFIALGCTEEPGCHLCPLSPLVRAGGSALVPAQMLQLGPLWDSARVTPLTLLDPEGCWAPWALVCGMLWMLGLAPTQTAAQPRGSAESRTAWGHIGVSWQGLEGNTE